MDYLIERRRFWDNAYPRYEEFLSRHFGFLFIKLYFSISKAEDISPIIKNPNRKNIIKRIMIMIYFCIAI